jgi:hypothetical protein
MKVRIVAAMFCAGTVIWIGAVPAHAEPDTNGSVNTVVGPTTSGTTVSQGTAGFGPGGTQATSASTTASAPPGPANGAAVATDQGSNLIVQPIPFNQVPTGGLNGGNGLIINNPLGTTQACPAGQTGFFVGQANNNAPFQVVCVPQPGAPASPGDHRLAAPARPGGERQAAVAEPAGDREPGRRPGRAGDLVLVRRQREHARRERELGPAHRDGPRDPVGCHLELR